MIVFVVGHSSQHPGARLYNGEHEHTFNARVGQYLAASADYPLKVLHKIPIQGAGANNSIAIQCRNLQASHVIELHINALDQRTPVLRSEAVYLPRAEDFANYLLKVLHSKYNIAPGRTGSPAGPKARGHHNLVAYEKSGITQAVLFEPCFGDTENESSSKIIPYPEEYALFLLEAMRPFAMP